MIRRPEELTEPIRQAVDHRAVVYSHVLLAVVIAVHTALDPASEIYHIALAFSLSTTLIVLILLRVFDLGTVNKRPRTYIIVYQIFCLLGIAFISDAATPYVVGLYLVVFASNLYYGARGVWITVACFGVTTIVKYVYLTTTLHIGLNDKLNIFVAFFVFTAVCSVYVNYQKVFDWDRAKLKETEAKLVSSINSLKFGFLITDDCPEVTVMNDASHQLLCGNNKHSSSNCPVVTLDHVVELFGAATLKQTIANSMHARKMHDIKSLHFNHRIWKLFISPIVDNQTTTGAAIIIQDVTEEYILNRSRDEFFSIASHELRTPLTTIRGNASMMLDYYPDNFKDHSLHEMVDDIHASSERLIGIVNDFLDVSRLEQGHVSYKIEPLELKEVTQKIITEMKNMLGQKKLSLELGDGFDGAGRLPNVLVDKDRLIQVIYNILGNAVRFTDTGTVTIDAEVIEHDMVKISVTDTGRGIDPKLQPLLFHKFQQAGDSIITRDGSKGTGLGLYISKLLTEGMGGKLSLERSDLGHGSTFSFTMPASTPARLRHVAQKPVAITDAESGLGIKLPVE